MPLWVGSVPGRKASRITVLLLGPGSRPVWASTRTSRTPDGTRNGVAGWSLRAPFMNSTNTGSAAEEPVSWSPKERGWS